MQISEDRTIMYTDTFAFIIELNASIETLSKYEIMTDSLYI